MTYIHPQADAFLTQLKAIGGPKIREIGAVAGRQMYAAMKGMFERPAPDMAQRTDMDTAGVPVRLYVPHGAATTTPVLVYFHGGGWVIGDLESHDSLCAALADELKIPVVATDYRLAPEHPFPAAFDDCEAVARWVAESPGALGLTVTGLVLAGDSAGGNLAAAVAQALAPRPAAVPVKAQFLIYPGVDMTATGGSLDEFATGYLLERADMDWFQDAYVPKDQQSDVRASPLLGTLAGQPPAVIVTCGLDPLRDQGRAYAARLIEAGVRVSYHEAAGHVHGAFSMRGVIPAMHDALLTCLADLKPMVEA
jgi:acetyl esterase